MSRMWRNENSHASLVGKQNVTATFENSWAVYQKLSISLPYDQENSLLDNYPREMKTCMQTKTYKQTFITLYVIAKK